MLDMLQVRIEVNFESFILATVSRVPSKFLSNALSWISEVVSFYLLVCQYELYQLLMDSCD